MMSVKVVTLLQVVEILCVKMTIMITKIMVIIIIMIIIMLLQYCLVFLFFLKEAHTLDFHFNRFFSKKFFFA